MHKINTKTLPILFNDLNLATLDDAQLDKIAQIDNLLPQTQCGLCGYADGCLPYAHAIITGNEAINLCVPGGDATSYRIACATNRPFLPAMPSKWQTNPTTARPIEVRAIIDESACIGCTKCLPACPVDAIIGTAKHMHSVITELCTGCELCVDPCPVDCIDVIPYPRNNTSDERINEQSDLRQRYHAHLNRLTKTLEQTNTPIVSHKLAKINSTLSQQSSAISQEQSQNTVALAKIRTQIKKLEKQLALKEDANKRAQLSALKTKLAQL